MRHKLLIVIIFVVFLILVSFIPVQKTNCNHEGLDEPVCGKYSVNGVGYPRFFSHLKGGDVLYVEFSWINFVLNIIIYGVISIGAVVLLERNKKSRDKFNR